MNERVRELRQQRAELIGQARLMREKVEKEKRTLNADERAAWDKYMADAQKLQEQAEDEQRKDQLEELENSLKGSEDPQAGQQELDQRAEEDPSNSPEYRSAFSKYLLEGRTAAFTPEERRAMNEVRAMQAGVAADGGYLKAPEEFVRKLLMGLDDAVWMRKFATVWPLKVSTSLGVPTLASDLEDADWTTELATGNEGSMTFGKRKLEPHPMAKRIKVSKTLLRVAALPVEDIVRDRLLKKFAATEEKAYLTGDGVEKPLGIFTASADGISTARDIATGNETTKITYDGLLAAKFALKEGYRRNARWMFHSDAVLQIMQIKDNNGQYILNPNLPDVDKLLNLPYHTSAFAPNTFTTGQYVGALGDLSYYWIADLLDLDIQKLVELYAETNQTGFIGRKEADGMPIMEEAFARVKLA